MIYSLDSGGSTLDIVLWNNKQPTLISSDDIHSLNDTVFNTLIDSLDHPEKIIVSGGKTHNLQSNKTEIIHINEIDAIANGGFDQKFQQSDQGIIVSMGTGTCIVGVNYTSKLNYEHLGGTGIGGGTFLALCKEMLGITDIDQIITFFSTGNLSNVDLTVNEIIGTNIGKIPGHKTAANLGKITRSDNYSTEDLAKGIINLIAQSIGTCAVFAAQAYKAQKITLVGKLTRIQPICSQIKETAELYNIEINIPEWSPWAMARGAGHAYFNSING